MIVEHHCSTRVEDSYMCDVMGGGTLLKFICVPYIMLSDIIINSDETCGFYNIRHINKLNPQLRGLEVSKVDTTKY